MIKCLKIIDNKSNFSNFVDWIKREIHINVQAVEVHIFIW